MSKMELIDAGLVQVLEKIPVQELLVEAMPSLREVSNLLLMKVLQRSAAQTWEIFQG
jgi:hypothetical protein